MIPDPDDRGAQILASNAGFEIVAVGDQVWFFDRRTRGPTIAAAVSGGVGAIASINALLMTVALVSGAKVDASWTASGIVLAIGLLGMLICWRTLELRRRRLDRPRAQLRPIVRLDGRTNTLVDPDGRPIAPVAQIRAARGLLIGSSAPAVVLIPAQRGRIEVYRSTLIGGRDIDDVLERLVRLGFHR